VSTGRIRGEDLHDAVQMAAAELERTEWRTMQAPAVAYIVLAEAVDLLAETFERYRREEETSTAQRAHDAIAMRNRMAEAGRSDGIGPLPDQLRRAWRDALQGQQAAAEGSD
jgi:hypothetical protein